MQLIRVAAISALCFSDALILPRTQPGGVTKSLASTGKKVDAKKVSKPKQGKKSARQGKRKGSLSKKSNFHHHKYHDDCGKRRPVAGLL
jgi:uncharacterized protein (DUF2147 family)